MPQALTKYFGSIEFGEAEVVQFPSGLPAFEEETQFLVMEPAASAPLIFLQSLRQPEFCFLALPMVTVDPKYHLAIAMEDLESLGIDSSEGVTCLAILAVTDNGAFTANLLAPVVINRVRRLGLQAVRLDSIYSHQHPLGEGACL